MSDVRTCLWFEKGGAEAAEFYVGLVAGSAVEETFGRTQSGEPLIVNFNLAGVPYQILNGGPTYTQSPAISIAVTTEDQAHTNRLWAALIADGGEESRCGWLVDRFGLSWQIIPRALPRLVGGDDPEGAARATQAMMTMKKIDIATLEAAYRGDA